MHSAVGGMGGSGAGAGGENFDLYGGIDPSLDPELAMAIRVSTEEARAQEEARVKSLQDQVLQSIICIVYLCITILH